MSENQDLTSHPLVKDVMENHYPVLKRSAEERLEETSGRDEKIGDEPVQLEEHEWYEHAVFKYLSAYISGFERLEHSISFISDFPNAESYENQGIDQHTWLEYHFSYYVITIVSLFDIALILTNEVFRLGNRERDCKRWIIMKNNWVRSTPVRQSLADLNRLIGPHRQNRNLHVHRGNILDPSELTESSDYKTLKAITFLYMEDDYFFEKEIIDLIYEGYVDEIREKLLEEIGAVRAQTWSFFDNLHPVYRRKSKILHRRRTLAQEVRRRTQEAD